MQTNTTNSSLTLSLRAHKLDNKDFFSKSDPYLVISKPVNDGWTPIRTSETIKVRSYYSKLKLKSFHIRMISILPGDLSCCISTSSLSILTDSSKCGVKVFLLAKHFL